MAKSSSPRRTCSDEPHFQLGRRVRGLARLLRGDLQLAQHRRAFGVIAPGGGGRGHHLTLAIEQDGADLGLQRPHMLGDSRLGRRLARGCGGEGALFVDGDKGADLPE